MMTLDFLLSQARARERIREKPETRRTDSSLEEPTAAVTGGPSLTNHVERPLALVQPLRTPVVLDRALPEPPI